MDFFHVLGGEANKMELIIENFEFHCEIKTKAVQECIRLITSSNDYVSTVNEIESKLRTILHRQNVQKKLLNQIYANHGFPDNEDVKKDKYLKEFYEDNFDYKFGNIID